MLAQDNVRPEHLEIVQAYNAQEIVSNAGNSDIQNSRYLYCMSQDEDFIHISLAEWEVLKDFVEKKVQEILEPGPMLFGELPPL